MGHGNLEVNSAETFISLSTVTLQVVPATELHPVQLLKLAVPEVAGAVRVRLVPFAMPVLV
jgi:hypothetical protein